MGKIRINQIYPKIFTSDYSEDNAERNSRLECYFSDVLENENIFLEDTGISERFNDLLIDSGRIFFFVGYRGTGKSVFLKKYFKIRGNTPFIQDTGLIVPILGRGDAEEKTPYDKVADCMKGICDRLENDYPETEKIFTDQGTEEFFQFILDTRASLLPELAFSEARNMSALERKCARIDAMQKQYKLGSQLLKLKFYIRKFCTDIKQLFIILDNIQNIYADEKKQQKFLEILIDTFECLEKYYGNKEIKLQTYLIVAVRPYNYRNFKANPKIQPYSEVTVWNNNKLNSAELFKKIAQKYKEPVIVDSETVSPESENFASDLALLSQKFRCKYSNMIEKLCFYDSELIMKAYKRILLNNTWVKEGRFRFMADKGRDGGLSFTNITCIRALACGEDKVYRRWEENRLVTNEIDRLIPNILYNEEDVDYGIFNLYTMKYFLRRFNSGMESGQNYIELGDYVDSFCSLLEEEIKTCMHSVNFLYRVGILRRSMHDAGYMEGVEYNEEFGSKNRLYITSRGSKLWDMLKGDSVLLELCREDRYFDPGIREVSEKSSYDLMMEGKQHILFLELLKLIIELYEKELEFYQKVCRKNKRQMYHEAFGKRPMTLTLLEGVSKSIQYSGCSNIMKNRNELEFYMISKWKELGD